MTQPRQLLARFQAPFSSLVHTSTMTSWLPRLTCAAWLALAFLTPLQAQDSSDESARDSTGVEESDEAYRRRMELEDARQRDLGYTLPPQTYAQKQEKLDKLPEESRDNIRDQLVDIIVENGDWEPDDALKDYLYEPTAAARANPELMQQEQEAWDEQIEKYHKREAAAFGTYLGPTPGPGNPTGEEGAGEEGSQADEAQAGTGQPGGGAGQEGRDDEGDPSARQAGTYDPYQANRSRSEEAVSTVGVQQSALDFLHGLQGSGQPPAAASGQTDASAQVEANANTSANGEATTASSQQNANTPTASESGQQSADNQTTTASEQAEAEPQTAAESSQQSADSAGEKKQQDSRDHPVEIDLTTPGVIPIEDLDKLQGAESPPASDG